MPMIPEKDQKAIREHFAKKLKQPGRHRVLHPGRVAGRGAGR